MRKLVLFSMAVCMLVLTASGCDKGKEPRRLYEKAGGFSFNPPDGWEIGEMPGLKYKVARGKTEGKFTPNINVVEEAFTGPLEDYVDANIKAMKEILVKFRVLSRESLTTEDGQPLIRLVIENEQLGFLLRQNMFFTGIPSKKYIITGTAWADSGDKLDGVFLQSVKTFRFH